MTSDFHRSVQVTSITTTSSESLGQSLDQPTEDHRVVGISEEDVENLLRTETRPSRGRHDGWPDSISIQNRPFLTPRHSMHKTVSYLCECQWTEAGGRLA